MRKRTWTKADNVVYFGNNVTDRELNTIRKIMDKHDHVFVSFDVTGRTLHQILGYHLAESLKDEYKVTVDYNYYICIEHKED